MSPDDSDHRRRDVLRKVAGGAVASVALSGVASAAGGGIDSSRVPGPEDRVDPDRVVENIRQVEMTSSDCYTEYKCVSEGCKFTEDERAYERTCCRRGGGYICEDWQATDQCCY